MGSGKDTVAKIIQYREAFIKRKEDLPYTLEEFLGGKDVYNRTFKYGDAYIESISIDSGWEVKKFAGKLKQIASILTGIPVSKFEDQEFKNSYLGEEWKTFFRTVKFNGIYSDTEYLLMTVRTFLQKLGCEAIRDNLHQDTWVNALFSDYNENSKWIISDVRFKNEFEAIKKRGGICIRVDRDLPVGDNHVSENEWTDLQFDHIVDNNGSLKELTESITSILWIEKKVDSQKTVILDDSNPITLLSYLFKTYDVDRIEEIINCIRVDFDNGARFSSPGGRQYQFGKNILMYEKSKAFWDEFITIMIIPKLKESLPYDPNDLVEPIIR